MDFHLFPFDYQLCPIHLESFGYSTADMTFNWVGNSSIQYNEDSETGGSLRMGDMVLMEKYIKPGIVHEIRLRTQSLWRLNSERFMRLRSDLCWYW